MMFEDVLGLFPAHIHSLTLVSDPDRLLAGEMMHLILNQRGFQIIQEEDPVFLHHRVEALRPFSPEHPLIITTSGLLADLPYDLYQPAYRLTLSLHHYFPNLAYPVLQLLTPDQIEKLETAPPVLQPLSRKKTMDYVLREVFGADMGRLNQPHALITWLNEVHHHQVQLPDKLRSHLTQGLKTASPYQGWELDRMIEDVQFFQDFVQAQWQHSIDQTLSGSQIKEVRGGYQIAFHHDSQMQDIIPSLVRRGMIRPVKITNRDGLPPWAQPGVTMVDGRLEHLKMLLEEAHQQIYTISPDVQNSWNFWSEFAQTWAEICSYINQSDLDIQPVLREQFRRLIPAVDTLFGSWLKTSYTALGGHRLPKPHHVHHIPHYLAYLRSLGKINKIVVLVLDGLSLADWQGVQAVWKKRHADWKMTTKTVLAQIPTITSISRTALISGLRPLDFMEKPNQTISEARAWKLFWSHEGINENTCEYLSLQYDRQINQQPELLDPKVNFWCLVDDTPDKFSHHATLGAADQQSSLSVWLDVSQEKNSLPLENLLDSFLERGFSVFITSDHGHVESTGFGQPSEGLLAQTRGKRARLYKDHLAALQVQNGFANTILWENDGLLPQQITALMPSERSAFAPSGEVVVTHGGTSIDEVFVPLIQISKERKE